MFANENNAIDGEFPAAEGQSVFDGIINSIPMPRSQLGTHVAFVDLMYVERHDVATGWAPFPVRRTSRHQPAQDDIGVRIEVITCNYGGQARPAPALSKERPAEKGQHVSPSNGHANKISENAATGYSLAAALAGT